MDQSLTLLGVTLDADTSRGSVRLLHDISFSLPRDSMTALIGESGSGKTTLALTITRLFTHSERYHLWGSIMLGDRPIGQLGERELRDVRQNSIRYVFQEPPLAFNPLMRIGHQIADAAGGALHGRETATLLQRVGLDQPERILDAYPHELSVGMLQRISIAMAIAHPPAVLIADEPTSSLDAAHRRQVMDLLSGLQHRFGIAVLVITHDPIVIEQYADAVVVLYAGRIIERAGREEFFRQPLHPFSRSLLDASRKVRARSAVREAIPIRFDALPTGCTFHPRCPVMLEACKLSEPILETTDSRRWIRCINWK